MFMFMWVHLLLFEFWLLKRRSMIEGASKMVTLTLSARPILVDFTFTVFGSSLFIIVNVLMSYKKVIMRSKK